MAGYLGASPVPQTIQKKQSFTATASQTTFTTTGYTDGAFINVYLNGVRLINGTDYTATNGSDIVLTSAASASDVLDFETFNEFTLVDQTLETPTFRTSATLKNDTHEDTDGGRESTLIFKGEQSGGEISTLAEIEASHDGTADDEKGDLIFRTNDGSDGSSPTEAMRIDSAGQVGIGVTNPHEYYSKELVVGGGANNGITIADTAGNSTNYVMFADGTSGNAQYRGYMEFAHSTDSLALVSYGKQRFFTSSDGSTTSERWNITTDGHFKAMSNGLGIDFSATEGSGATSSILDDYEEGDWTPTLTDTNSNYSFTYHENAGAYVKVGSVVHLTCRIDVDVVSGSGSGGSLRILGLPFNTASGGKYQGGTTPMQGYWGSAGNRLMIYIPQNVNYFQIYANAFTSNYTTLNAANVTHDDSIIFSATYITS